MVLTTYCLLLLIYQTILKIIFCIELVRDLTFYVLFQKVNVSKELKNMQKVQIIKDISFMYMKRFAQYKLIIASLYSMSFEDAYFYLKSIWVKIRLAEVQHECPKLKVPSYQEFLNDRDIQEIDICKFILLMYYEIGKIDKEIQKMVSQSMHQKTFPKQQS